MTLHRTVTLLGLALGLLGLGLQFALTMPQFAAEVGWGLGLVRFLTFFTILTNLMLVLIYASELSGSALLGWWRSPVTRAMMAAAMLLVMLFYHVMLAPSLHFEGGMQVATVILHYIAPSLYIGFWLVYARHGALTMWHVLPMMVPPALYLAWVLLRGSWVGEYPYEVLNVAELGANAVINNVSALIFLFMVLAGIAVTVDRRIAAGGRSAQTVHHA